MEQREVKVFRQAAPTGDDGDEKPPYPFQLVFEDAEGAEQTFDFEARPKLAAGGHLALTAILRFGDNGKQVVDLAAMRTFFRRALFPDDWARLDALLEDDDLFVEMDLLGDVFVWLVEEYTGRPFRQSERSPRSSPSNGRPSTVKRRSPART